MSTPTLLAGEAQRQIIGCCLDLVLQGTLLIQYYVLYPRDKIYLKTAVAGLCLLTILKSAQSLSLTKAKAPLSGTTLLFLRQLPRRNPVELYHMLSGFRWETGNPLMVAVIGSYVQAYFCYRLYAISGSIYVVAPLAAIFLFALVAMAVATYFITVQDIAKIPVWFNAHLGSVFGGFKLTPGNPDPRSPKYSRRRASHFDDGLLPAAVAEARPAAIRSTDRQPPSTDLPNRCTSGTLVNASESTSLFSVRFTGDKALFSLVFNMPLPKLYAISMMFTLNARRRIRLSGRSGQYGSSSGGRSGPVKSPRAPVFTATQTEKHVDIRATLGRDIHKGRREIKDFGREDIKSAPEFV
ncbi:hypothetical protein B0H14DRAFT_2598272 [Mycena olivaceomarginata]|nr:hypothetical protein B0H14DRAFT_2598272 [Mycena olivaceomarginata]